MNDNNNLSKNKNEKTGSSDQALNKKNRKENRDRKSP